MKTSVIAVFAYDNYKLFIQEWLLKQAHNGRGQMRQLASHLKIHSSLVSHIVSRDKHFTVEQAAALAGFFSFTDLEADYFVTLLELERAGTQQLKTLMQQRLARLREEAQELDRRLPRERALREDEKATFYSSWHYSALRLLSSVPRFANPETMQRALGLSAARFQRILQFLLAKELIVKEGESLQIGPARTHVASDSNFVANHHRNWRIKSLSQLDSLGRKDLSFTGPMTISAKDAATIREELVQLIERVSERAVASESEQLQCLTIDWFEVGLTNPN